jgi:hypothetical protein
MTEATPAARRQRTAQTRKHNWLENEYMVAIYMALYSSDYKVGIYNHEQYAHFFGITANAMKMMVDNFKAFAGKTRLSADCPKMEEAFNKYKGYPEFELKQLSAEYLSKIFREQRAKIDVEKYVNNIGKAAFIKYYEVFNKAARDSDNQMDYIDELKEKWTVAGKRMRISMFVRLYRTRRVKEALEIIVNSKRIDEKYLEKAKTLLSNC